MGSADTVEDDNDVETVDVPTPPEMVVPEYPTSNLHLLILGSAFFALWAGSVSEIDLVLMRPLNRTSLHLYYKRQLYYPSFRRSLGSLKARSNGSRRPVPLSGQVSSYEAMGLNADDE
jgi:hypothetical protein